MPLSSSRLPEPCLRGSNAAFLGIVVCWAVGCTPKATPVPPFVWATGPTERIGRTQQPVLRGDYFDRASGAIQLDGAVNETVGCRLSITATRQPAAGLQVAVGDLTGEGGIIRRGAVRVYRAWPVIVERYPNWYLRTEGRCEPREFPDALITVFDGARGAPAEPTAGTRLDLLVGQTLPLYFELRIPTDARPGVYRGTITIRNDDGIDVHTPLILTVRDIYLRSDPPIAAIARVQLRPLVAAHCNIDAGNLRLALRSDRARRLINRSFALLAEHGISPHTDEVLPDLSLDRDGRVDFDWKTYDAVCGPLLSGEALSGGRPAVAWPLPVDLTQPDPAHFDGIESSSYEAVLVDALSKAAAHFEALGALDRAFVRFDYPRSANPTQADIAQFRRLSELTRRADPRLAIASSMIPQSMRPFGWFEHVYADLSQEVDIWAPPARYQYGPTLERLHARARRTWLMPDRPPFSGSLAVEAALTQPRSLPWQAFLQGHEAVYLPHASDFPPDVFNQPIADPQRASDRWLIYPGAFFGLDEPIPSLRLKSLQTGLAEAQLLTLLAEHGRAETARLIAGSLIKACGADAYGDNYQDAVLGRRIDAPALWDLARRILLVETELAVNERRAEPGQRDALMALWSKFLRRTRRVEMWVESTRLAADPRPSKRGFLVNIEVAVRSELRTPVNGVLRFGALAPDWAALADHLTVAELPELSAARRKLSAELPRLPPCDLDGHFAVPVVFDAGASGTVQTEAILSAAAAPPAIRPIVIDGRLDDWAPLAFNTAADFRLIEARPGPRRRAESQTVAWFCRDDERLYIAVRAASPDGETGGEVESNVVRYEDLRPTTESGDLVEILIDPTGSATRPDDLYHLVIKSTGDPLFERGVSVEPPIGRVRAWPGEPPAYAVMRLDGGWVAELAIAVSALGGEHAGAAPLPPVWGINVARLEPLRGEYSDWSRAARYCYDPRTLGNLVWGR